jgi:hypothetical protein
MFEKDWIVLICKINLKAEDFLELSIFPPLKLVWINKFFTHNGRHGLDLDSQKGPQVTNTLWDR